MNRMTVSRSLSKRGFQGEEIWEVEEPDRWPKLGIGYHDRDEALQSRGSSEGSLGNWRYRGNAAKQIRSIQQLRHQAIGMFRCQIFGTLEMFFPSVA